MDKFTQLTIDLKNGDLRPIHIAIALSTYYKEAEHLPEGIRDLIGGTGKGTGLVHQQFRFLQNTIGDLEIAYRRGDSQIIKRRRR